METSYINITRAIINVLQRINKPVEPDEIAFRVRSTESIVNDELDKLESANLVRKDGNKYSLEDVSRNSNLESLYSY